jgi:ABC-type bacteriocin/lantibiotic exporter with double-glycine peptidase domain
LNGSLSIGGLVAFNSLVALANTPIRNLLVLWDNLQRCDVLLNRVDDVLQQEPEQGHDRSALRPVSSLAGHVTLSNVGFRCGEPEAPAILEQVTLDGAPAKWSPSSAAADQGRRLWPSAWPVCSSRLRARFSTMG